MGGDLTYVKSGTTGHTFKGVYPQEELKKNEDLIKYKTIFIDEAQDLNPTQFSILSSLKDKLELSLNLIGDPNQNIYQFRKSTDKYLREFISKEFLLTINFRL